MCHAKTSVIIFSIGVERRHAGYHAYLKTGHGRLFMHRDEWRPSDSEQADQSLCRL